MDEPPYIVEFRFSRKTREELAGISRGLARILGVRRVDSIKPRMTIAGPFHTNDTDRLVSEVLDAAALHPAGIRFDGYGKFGHGVVFCNMVASNGFMELHNFIKKRLSRFCRCGGSYYSEYKPYSIIDVKDDGSGFDKVLNFMDGWVPPDRISLDLVILRHGRPTLRCPVKYQGVDKASRKVVCMDGTVHIASDTHFGHAKVIQYSDRPFRGVGEMNRVMVKRWNKAVRNDGTMLFLGDLSYRGAKWMNGGWLSRLNGKVSFLRGNHDNGLDSDVTLLEDPCILEYHGAKFLLTHVPYRPAWWDGWILHGHLHNGDLKRYPRINRESKTANVGVDLSNYAPTNLAKLSEEIFRK